MRIFDRYRFLAGVLVFALCFWLIPNLVQRLDDPPDKLQNRCPSGRKDDPKLLPHPLAAGGVLKIRLTDAGEFVNRCEFTNVMDELVWDQPHKGEIFHPCIKIDAVSSPKLVVLYVHGWKHGSDDDDPDYRRFQKLVSSLQSENQDKKQVLGVYIGWNARSKVFPFSLFPLDNLTFWSKKTIADRIAHSGVVTKIVSAIGAVRRTTGQGSDQFIVLGHSFGARLLFSAVGQSLLYETERAHPGYPGGHHQSIRAPVTSVILVNPAFEASLYTSLDDVIRGGEKFDPVQPPLLLSVASKGDEATKIFFPIGQWFGLSRTESESATLGNYDRYRTHQLTPKGKDKCDNVPSQNSMSEMLPGSKLCLFRDLTIKSDEFHIQTNNPFLVASATTDIIKDHNDIWNETFSTWLFEYITAIEHHQLPSRIDEEMAARLHDSEELLQSLRLKQSPACKAASGSATN